MSDLRLLNQTTVSSSVSTVNVTNVFSSDFDIYKIVFDGISTAGSTATPLHARLLNSSGSPITSSEYDYVFELMKAEASFTESRATNQTKWDNFFGNPDDNPELVSGVAYIFNPFSSSSYTFAINQVAVETRRFYKMIQVFTELTSITGFQAFESNSRPINSGVFKTYGLRVNT
jgi:hypothetical protein|tara:strand:+ start:180 stop:701 length:522 start_codon:yes stop_codon:yes gene_type:complete